MDNETMYQLNKRLSEWVGLKDYPSFACSLNDCFAHLIPKMKELGWCARVQYSPLRDNDTGKKLFDWSGYAELFYVGDDVYTRLHHKNYWTVGETVAIALCEAIDEWLRDEHNASLKGDGGGEND